MNSDLLRKLLALQKIDTELMEIRRRYKKISDEIQQEGGLGALRKKLEACKAKELEHKLQIARSESEKSSNQERLDKLEKQLFSGLITNVREMKAVEIEQAELKRRLEQIEESREPLERELEGLQQEVTQLEGSFEEQAEEWKNTKTSLEQEKKDRSTEYDTLRKQRESKIDGISEFHLKLYREMFKITRGTAIVRVERGFCSGCNLSLPQSGKGIKFAGNMPQCPNCSRFIIFD